MAYGIIKVDQITFTNGGIDQTVTVSGIVQSISGNITATGTIQGATIIGTSTVSGATVTGNAGVFTTVTGGSAGFTTVTGTTVTGTTANFNVGTFTSQVSGATVTGNLAQFTSVTGGTAGFTTVTGTTVTGTTANFITLSGTTVTGNAGQFTTITGTSAGFTTVTGTTITGSVGNFGSGSAAAPSVSVGTTDNGIYSPGADQVAISTNGTGRLFVDSSGKVGVGTGGSTIQSVLHVSKNGAEGFEFIPGDSSNTNVILHYNRSGAAWATNDQWAANHIFRIQSSEVARIDSSGRLGLGTSSPVSKLQLIGSGGSTGVAITLDNGGNITAQDDPIGVINARVNNSGVTLKTRGSIGFFNAYPGEWSGSPFRNKVYFSLSTSNGDAADTVTEKLRVTSAGYVGVGTATPTWMHEVYKDTSSGTTGAYPAYSVNNPNASGYSAYYHFAGATNKGGLECNNSSDVLKLGATGQLVFATNTYNTERARIDSSGRLLVGTSTARSNYDTSIAPVVQIESTSVAGARFGIVRNAASVGSGSIFLGKTRGVTNNQNDIVLSGDGLGSIDFYGADGTNLIRAASIGVLVDGTPGANDMPGRLVFSTTADGASSPTERMRIDNAGFISLGGDTNTGFSIPSADNLAITTGGTERIRITNNGAILGNNSSIFATGRLETTTFATAGVNLYLYAGSQPSGTGSYNFYQSIGQGIYQVAAFGGPEYSNTGPGWAVGYALFSVDYDNVVTIISSDIRNSGDAGMNASFTATSDYLVWSTYNQGYQNYPKLFFNRIGAYV